MIEVRASSFGSCLKAQAALCLGYTPADPPAKMQAVFDRGDEHEALNSLHLMNDGWRIVCDQEEIGLALSAGTITGHLDGKISLFGQEDQRRVWESKSPAAWAKFQHATLTADWSDQLAYRYAWQISIYMHATGFEALVTCWDEEHGNRMFGIEVPPFTMQDVEERLGLIAAIVATGQLPAECSQRDYPCPVWYLHQDETPDVTDDPLLDSIAGDYEFWAGQEKDAKEKKQAAAGLLRARVESEAVTDLYKVTVYPIAGRKGWDEEAMVADGVDVEKYRTVGKPSNGLKVTRRGED